MGDGPEREAFGGCVTNERDREERAESRLKGGRMKVRPAGGIKVWTRWRNSAYQRGRSVKNGTNTSLIEDVTGVRGVWKIRSVVS